MAVEDVARAIMQVRPHLLEFRRPRSRKSPNFGAAATRSETSTRYVVIDPVLRGLGWDLSDPSCCRVEYWTKYGSKGGYKGGRRVDYALLDLDGCPLILVEAKRLDASFRIPISSTAAELNLAEKRQKSWDDGKPYLRCRLNDVGTAWVGMLTNGQEWLFVERVEDGDWKWDRRAIKLSGSSVDRSAELLYDRLARERYPVAG